MAYLNARVDFERAISVPYHAREFRLDRVRELLARLGNPHQRLAVVHIAGTKGKGSTAAMVGAILTAAGRRTGVFTSPHLHGVEERIAIDGRHCSTEEFVGLLNRVIPAVDAMDALAAAAHPPETGPTYFDITTAMGLVHFVQRGVDAAVLEVGLGGRLDSTNVCVPVVSVITSISYDHTRLLGTTLESIAREKAGIIKPGVPVVSGVLPESPRAIIRRIAEEQGCRLVERGADFDATYRPPQEVESASQLGRMDFWYRAGGRQREYRDLPLRLLGRHQAANAAVALATLEELRDRGWSVPEEAVRAGLEKVIWPARIELIARRPAVIIDAAHNLASVEALVEVLDESFRVPRRLLLFATTQDKDLRGMLGALLPRFDQVVFTRYRTNPRAVPPQQLAEAAYELSGRRWPVIDDPRAAWQSLRSAATPDDLVCVAGSFFIAAEIREIFRAEPRA